jgi:hypothetical protein
MTRRFSYADILNAVSPLAHGCADLAKLTFSRQGYTEDLLGPVSVRWEPSPGVWVLGAVPVCCHTRVIAALLWSPRAL